MLWQRIITAFILIPIVVGAIVYLPNTYFEFATAILLSLAAWEWSKLTGLSKLQQIIYLIALWAAFALTLVVPAFFVLSISAVTWLCALYFVWSYPDINKKIFINGGCYWSLLVLVPCWVGLNILRTYDIKYLFAVLFIVWSADIGAYFVGKFFGKHNLAPKVSPKKTIEGLVGGILLALLVGNAYFIYLKFDWMKLVSFVSWLLLIASILYILLIAEKRILSKNKYVQKQSNFKSYLKLSFLELVFIIIIAIIYCLVWGIGFKNWRLLFGTSLTTIVVVLFAVLGDLFESLLKRIAEVKDSGTLLPGHGGILDRIDSLLSAVPIFVLWLFLLTYL